MSQSNTGRRQFLSGLLAAGLIPRPSWADAGSPAHLSAAARKDGAFVLCGIDDDLNAVFQIPLPARGHAAAAHPTRPEAVAFARRPGTFAIVIDCVTGRRLATLNSPEGRHFYGHGVYSANGDWLFTTENDYEAGRGRIGVWDVSAGYARAGEFDSGGIGPHDIKRVSGSETLVVANGGIETHPASGRTKLNIVTMQPNLAYLDNGRLMDVVMLLSGLHKNSIRHLATGPQGAVAFGMQWQGDEPVDTLVGWHRQGEEMTLITTPPDHLHELDGYVGSIAWSRDGRDIAVTSPRGGGVHLYDAQTAQLSRSVRLGDVCGAAAAEDGFLVTSGTGELRVVAGLHTEKQDVVDLMWDNHLVRL